MSVCVAGQPAPCVLILAARAISVRSRAGRAEGRVSFGQQGQRDGSCARARTVFGEEIGDGLTLVALQLQHVSHFIVRDHGAVAVVRLLERLEDLLEIELLVEALHRRDALAAIALLHADVDQIATGSVADLFVLLLAALLLLLLLTVVEREGVEVVRKRVLGSSQVVEVHALAEPWSLH